MYDLCIFLHKAFFFLQIKYGKDNTDILQKECWGGLHNFLADTFSAIRKAKKSWKQRFCKKLN